MFHQCLPTLSRTQIQYNRGIFADDVNNSENLSYEIKMSRFIVIYCKLDGDDEVWCI